MRELKPEREGLLMRFLFEETYDNTFTENVHNLKIKGQGTFSWSYDKVTSED